jgi:hypothetical protein
MRKTLCTVIALTIAATGASAARAQQPSPIQRIIAQEDAASMTLLRRQAVTGHAPPAAVVVTVDGGGFDWGDAGIGGAGGVALALLGTAGIVLVRDGRRQKAHG